MTAPTTNSVSRLALAIAAAIFCAAPAATQEREGRRLERREAAGLDSLERRVRILDFARAAHGEAGHERNAAALTRAVKYGRILLSGNERAAEEASEGGPSLGNLAELLQAASGLYRESGNQERAGACRSLAQYYAQRLEGAEAEEREGNYFGPAVNKAASNDASSNSSGERSPQAARSIICLHALRISSRPE